MAISLKHLFTSPKTDSADATLVQPSNWNAEHVLTQSTNRLLGRTTAGAGPTEEISVGVGLTLESGEIDIANPSPIFTGMIVMWSGAIESIPAGWALCDGANGTPNLRNRFIVGAGSAYAPGNTGGVDSVTLSVDQMPAHNHTGATGLNGRHNHTVLVADAFSADQGGSGASNAGVTTRVTSTEPDHNHSIASQGGNQAHENRPPYYALALIMKL